MSQKFQIRLECRWIWAVLCAVLGCMTLVSAATIYVDDSAAGVNDGSSWTDAYVYLQDALHNAENGDEVWVAEGEYVPDSNALNPQTGDRNATFQLIKGVSLYGGFPDSGDPNMADRDAVAYETILSGDIGVLDDSTDNSYHVVTAANNAALDGFIVTQGYANGGGWASNAGGMLMYPYSSVIKNCVFIDNYAGGFGGAVFAYSVSTPNTPTIENCKFIGNSSTDGAVGFHTCSSPIVKNCVFSGNNSGGHGGGMYCNTSSASVTNCSFTGNSAVFGGAFYSSGSTPNVLNCIMWGNSASSGSQIYSAANVTYCAVQGGWGDPEDMNINQDPNFIDADGADDVFGTSDDNLRLSPYSICINAADPETNDAGQFDVEGQSRMRYQRIDMGAYETFPIEADLDANETVDPGDLILFTTERWLIDADLNDFAVFARQWLYGAN